MSEIIHELRERKQRYQSMKALYQDASNQIDLLNTKIAKINAIIDAIQGIDD